MSERAAVVTDPVVPYPPGEVASYRELGLWGDRTLAGELRTSAGIHGHRPAIRSSVETITYAELDRRADHIGAGLIRLGLAPGSRVLLQIGNHAESVVAWYGLLKAGLVPVCTLPQHREHELLAIAAQAQPAAHLVQGDVKGHDLVAFAREIAAEQPSLRHVLTIRDPGASAGTVALEGLREPDDAAAAATVDAVQASIPSHALGVLQLSGGTTSTPKLIPRLHAEYWYNARLYAEATAMDEHSELAHLLPLVHNAGIVCAVHAAAAAGACIVPESDPGVFLELARSGSITHMLLVRPPAQRILETPVLHEALRSLRVVTWASGPLPPEVRDGFERGEARVVQIFGMGEGMLMLTPLDAPPEVRHHSVGVPLSPLDEVRVYAPGTEEPVEPGEHGELCARGPYTIRGYYDAAERNAEAFTSDGFYRTGDVVVEKHIAGARWYSLEDRIKDLVNRGGEKINALEIEELLVGHPAIEKAALVAMPDQRLGERACAFVVPAAGTEAPTVQELQVYLDGLKVAKFKWPERVESRETLPLTNIHKVNKALLRREIGDILAGDRTSRAG